VNRIRFVFALTAAIVLLGACDLLRGPVLDERTDGQIVGTLTVSRGRCKEGEGVEVVFTIKNVSDLPVLLRREDAFVQDIMLFSYELEGQRSTQSRRDLRELTLAPRREIVCERVLAHGGAY